MKNKWNFIDLKLADMRLNKIKKYIPEHSSILDVGCGYHCKLLKQLKNYIKRGYGIDFEVDKKEKFTLFNLDISKDKFPMKDNSIDIVTNLAVIEHLIDPTTMLSEIYRVLKHNGKLLLTTPTPLSKPILELGAQIGIFNKKEVFDHKCYYNKIKLFKVLEPKFQIIKHNYFEFKLNQFVVCKVLK